MATPPNSRSEPRRLAVVTVSYGSDDVLEAFLASISAASHFPLRVIVADNRPDDSSGHIRKMTLAAGAEYLPMASNRGYGHAINAAVRTLPPEIEWVIVSNPDVTFSPDSVDMLLSSGSEDLSIAAMGPRILSSNGDVYPSARKIPSLRSGVGHALLANLWPRNPWSRGYRRDDEGGLTRRDTGWLSGACLMVRRSVFDELDGFDESYFMYFEDVDLGYRIGQRGLRNVYEPSATVMHTGAHSTQDDAVRMIQAHHESAIRFLSKKYSAPFLWPLRAALRTGLTFRARIAARQPRL